MEELRDPWLVAAWPGMGLVAHLAAAHLVRELGADELAEVPPDDHFDLASVEVRRGMLQPLRLPRTTLYGWRNPGDGRDLVLLVGQSQPVMNVRRFCAATLELAEELGVSRVLTFAAMAMPSRPTAPARVLAAATDAHVLAELRGRRIPLMERGEVGGLNGVFLAAAAERGISGACLLGEFPYYASAVPNPKAAAAVLRSFASWAGVELDLSAMDQQAVLVEQQLSALVERAEEAARHPTEPGGGRSERAHPEEEAEVPDEWPAPEDEQLSPADAARLEVLFAEAVSDRSKAGALKAELDRLDVFERYEDRFLDLFKQAE